MQVQCPALGHPVVLLVAAVGVDQRAQLHQVAFLTCCVGYIVLPGLLHELTDLAVNADLRSMLYSDVTLMRYRPKFRRYGDFCVAVDSVPFVLDE